MTDKQSAHPLERGLQILTLLARHPEGQTFTQILTALDAPKASVARLLRMLRDGNFLFKDEESGLYQLGPAMAVFAHSRSVVEELTSLAAPLLASLRDRTGNTALLSIRTPQGMLTAAKKMHPASVSMRTVGVTKSDFDVCPWGWVFFLCANPTDQERILADLEKPRAFARHLKEIHPFYATHGFTFDDATVMPTVRRLAAPVLDAAGNAVACLALGGNLLTIPDDKIDEYGQALIDACQTIQAKRSSP